MQLVPTFLFVVTLNSAWGLSTVTKRKVLVTGAGGKTGGLVMGKLFERPAFTPIGVVRTAESKERLVKEGAENRLVPRGCGQAAALRRACGRGGGGAGEVWGDAARLPHEAPAAAPPPSASPASPGAPSSSIKKGSSSSCLAAAGHARTQLAILPPDRRQGR